MAENIMSIVIEAVNKSKEAFEEAKSESKSTADSVSADNARRGASATASAETEEEAATRIATAKMRAEAAQRQLTAAEDDFKGASAEFAASADGDTAAADRFVVANERLVKAQAESATATKESAAAQEEGAAKTDTASASSAGGLAKLGMAAAAAGAVVVGAAVKMGAESQEQTAKMAASMGITVQAAQQMTNAFMSTAGTSTFSGQEMEAAFAPVGAKLMQLNGGALSAAQGLNVMKSATDIAEATGQDLGTSTSALVSVMQTYGLSVDQAAQASNTLTNASRLTGSPVSDLATAMDRLHAKLGPIAPSLADTGTLVAALSQQGLTGSRGILGVTTALQTLMGGSKATKTEIGALGLKVTDSKGAFVGMGSVIEQLQPKFAKMSQAQQEAAGKALFGASAAGVLNNVIKQGPAAYDKLSESVNEVGSAHEAAEKASSTFQGGLEKLKAAGSDLMTNLGTALMPIVMQLMGVFEGMAKTIENVVGWMTQHKAIAGLLLTVLGTVAGVILTVTTAIKLWTIAQAALDVVLNANPISILIIAIAALVAGLIYAWTHFSGFRSFIEGMWKGLESIFKTTIDAIVGFFKQWGTVALAVLMPFIGIPLLIWQHWGQITGRLSDVWNTVWGFLKQWGPLALSILLPFIGIPLLIWQHFGQIVGWLKSVWNAARADLGSFVNWVSGAFNGMIGFFESIPGRIASIFTAAWNGITNGLKAALNWVIDRLNSFHVSIPSWVPVVGGDTFGFNIPHVAVGGPVSGMALVGEQGPELVNLPGGSSVYPNSNTMSMLNGMGGGGSVQVDFNITGNTNDALALIINQLIRMNKIQIRQSQVRPG